RGIFDVRDDEVDLVVLAQHGHAAPDQLAARPSDDVADEENANHATGRSPAIGMVVVRPRRSVIFGSETRNSPATSEARALAVSHGLASRATRANRPYARSTR